MDARDGSGQHGQDERLGGGIVQGGDLAVTGALTVADNAVLDVSAFDDGGIAPGDRLFIAAAEGTVTVPPTLRLKPDSTLAL